MYELIAWILAKLKRLIRYYIISTHIQGTFCLYSVSHDLHLHSAYGIQPPEFRHHTICRSDSKRFGAADNDWAYPPKLNHCEQAKNGIEHGFIIPFGWSTSFAERNRYSIQLSLVVTYFIYRLAMYLSSAMIISHFRNFEFQIRPNLWDIKDLSAQPPWKTNISDDITNLSNYFVTSDGEDFITIFNHATKSRRT